MDEGISNIREASEAAAPKQAVFTASGNEYTAKRLKWGGFRNVVVPLREVIADAARKCVKRGVILKEIDGKQVHEETFDIDTAAAIIALAEALPDLPDAAEALVLHSTGASTETMQEWEAGEMILATKLALEVNWDMLQEFLGFLTDGNDDGAKPSPESKVDAPRPPVPDAPLP